MSKGQNNLNQFLIFGGALMLCLAFVYKALLITSLAAAPVRLLELNVHQGVGTTRLELTADRDFSEAIIEQENKTGETIVRIRRASSSLLKQYPVSGAFVHRLRTISGERGGESFVEILIAVAEGAVVKHQKTLNRLTIDVAANNGAPPTRNLAPRRFDNPRIAVSPENTTTVTRTTQLANTPRVALLANPTVRTKANERQAIGTLRGEVTDQFGGLIVNAQITIVDANGVIRQVSTDGTGGFLISGLAPGRYTARASAPGFAVYENNRIEITSKPRQSLNITLGVALEKQEVTVAANSRLGVDPENNAGAMVLRGAALDALPDDPERLAATLQALAGPSAGPGGAELLVDGLSDDRLPPKESILEIRINQNPFSAQFDRPGFGRIEIITKPGTDKFRGRGFFNFNDESLNARNPFEPRRASSQSRFYGGNLSGPIIRKRASFFFEFERNELDNNAVVNANILDSALNLAAFNQVVPTPQRSVVAGTRFDYKINNRNTFAARYSYSQESLKNAGIGDFYLPSLAYNTTRTEQSLRLTATSIINERTVNELRLRFQRERRREQGDNSIPTVEVFDAFRGGGAQIGQSFDNENRWELQNYTSWSSDSHALKVGGRLRGVRLRDVSPRNFGGTFSFAGGIAPQLDANNNLIRDPNGSPIFTPITSIERYRRTLLFQQQGLSPAEVRSRGGGATQFSIAGGDPEASASRTDAAAFVQYDWRVRPNFTVSFGLRAEKQSNLRRRLDFAPRLGFAFSPGGGETKTVIRGGFGIFYDRLSENLFLQANRFNGSRQRRFVVSDPIFLDFYPQVPSILTLSNFAVPQTIRRLADDLRAPYALHSTLGIERELPFNFTVSATYLNVRLLHALRSRNINAPLAGQTGRVRPLGNVGNIFLYESSGIFNQQQLIIAVNNRFHEKFSIFANYTLGKAKSNTDGAGNFPVNSYDTSIEYGRAANDIRHSFTLGGSITTLWDLQFDPLIIVTSGAPFNITTGDDVNEDTLFNDRPAFAADLTKAGVIQTRFGAFDPNPRFGQTIIPRNFGSSPAFFSADLRVSKTFGFGGKARVTADQERYNLIFALLIQNILNRTNLGIPIGNLGSPFFGISPFTAGDSRRVEAQTRFSF